MPSCSASGSYFLPCKLCNKERRSRFNGTHLWSRAHFGLYTRRYMNQCPFVRGWTGLLVSVTRGAVLAAGGPSSRVATPPRTLELVLLGLGGVASRTRGD